MYSIVLVMALSGGAEVPAAHHKCSCACSCACYGCNCACNCACSGRGHKHHNRCHGCNCACYGCACYGCCGCCGPVVNCCGPVVSCACTGHPVPPPPPPPPGKKKDMPKPGKTGGTEEASATIIVTLPAQATLKVDDYATTSTSGTRVFVTPALEAGKEFSYTLSAEIVRDGKKVTTSKQVTVRAGEETRATLEFPTAAVVQK